MTRLILQPLTIPPRLGVDSLGYGSAVVGLPGLGGALFAAHAGSAVRCMRVDPDGEFTVIAKVRGLLRDAVPEGDGHLWLLATHALHLVDLTTNLVVETIRTGVPQYPARLIRLDAGHLLLSVMGSGTATILSMVEHSAVRRIRMPTVDLLLEGTTLTLCSFERGVARRVDATWSRVGQDQIIPTAIAPVRVGSGVAAALTDLVPVMPGSALTRPRSRGIAALFDADLRIIRESEIDGLERIDCRTPDGALVGVTRDAVVLLDPDTLEDMVRSPRLGWNPVAGPVGPGAALVLADGTGLVPAVSLVHW